MAEVAADTARVDNLFREFQELIVAGDRILSVSLDPQPMTVVRDLALSASLDRAERWGRQWT